MADRGGRPNTWLWALILAIAGALLAGVGHAVIAYYTVTGYQFDWLEWSRQPLVERDTAALEMSAAVFTFTLVTAMLAGTVAYLAAKKGWLRGQASKGEPGHDHAWSEFVFLRAMGLAGFGSLLATVLVYAAATYRIDTWFPSTEGIDGPAFFALQLVVGVLVALLAAARTTVEVANTHARGHLVDEDPRGNLISRIQLFSSRNAPAVVLVTLLLTAGLGFGVTQIHTDVDVADVLPRGNGNTTAAQNVTSEFKSTFTQQVTLQLKVNPTACREDSQRQLPNRVSSRDCRNITDEVYVRAMDELYQIMLEEQEPLRYTVGVNSFYKLINWTLAGGQDADPGAFAIPGSYMDDRKPTRQDEMRYAQVNQTVWAAIADTVTPVIDPSFDQAASLYLVETETKFSSQEIGQAALDFRDEYVQMVDDGETKYTVWGPNNPPVFTVDIPVANAHSSELAEEDFVTLFPIIFLFIIITLYFSFRNFTAIGIAGSTLLVAATWTYGAMGHMDIALNTLNLTVLPLILGVGIDFSIHQITEFANHKREGMSDEEALRTSGGFAGVAMAIATITSSSGLLVMTISPSLLMAQLGFLSALGILSTYALTITLMPALLTLAPNSDAMGAKFEPSALFVNAARNLSRQRVVVVLMVLLLSGLTVIGTQDLGVEEFGEPALNFPEDDPLREEHVEGLKGFYDLEEGGRELKTNIVVFEGDNTDLQSHRYIEAAQAQMAGKENLNLDTSRTLPFLLRTWLTVKDGAPGAGQQIILDNLAQQGIDQAENYPRTRAEIQREMDAMYDSPLATFAALFASHPDYNLSIMTLATTTGSFEDAEAAWQDVWNSLDEVQGQKPHDLKPAFVGNTATNYLFINEELPWLTYLGYVSAVVVTLLALVFTRSIRATLAVVAVMGLTSLWWLGTLPTFDIGLAITLMLPAVFITSIGSDYAIHMVWNLIRNPDREEVYGVVGKAVLYSMITTVGAFAIFTQTQNVAASEAMLATVVAIGVIFQATLLVTPLFFPLEEEDILDYAPKTKVREAPPAVKGGQE